MDPIAVSPAEAARMLGIDRSTFYRQIYPFVLEGKIQSLKIGRSRRILVASLKAWVETQTKVT
jgi:excisionase family DNA binding protein